MMARLGVYAVLAILAALPLHTQAAPMPPWLALNETTKECIRFVPGDECGDAVIPEGWTIIDDAERPECPEGYTEIRPFFEWVHFKAPHCCTEGHSGSSGDCVDVVINSRRKDCAFVEDIAACAALPKNWEAWGKDCPAGYEWVEAIACEEPAERTVEATATPVAEGDETAATATPESGQPPLPCPAPLPVALPLAVMAFVVWVVRRHV